jgi:hypothetical protein
MPLQRPFRSTALIACVFTLALWFVSTLGLVHDVVHAPGLARTPTTATPKAAATSLLGSVAALFTDHHDGDAQCRIYDQLSHGPVAIAAPLIVLPLVLPTATFDFFQGEALARWISLFQARGPPFSR